MNKNVFLNSPLNLCYVYFQKYGEFLQKSNQLNRLEAKHAVLEKAVEEGKNIFVQFSSTSVLLESIFFWFLEVPIPEMETGTRYVLNFVFLLISFTFQSLIHLNLKIVFFALGSILLAVFVTNYKN